MLQLRLRTLCVGAALILGWATSAQAASLTLAWDADSGATGYVVSWGALPGVYTHSLDVGNQTTSVVPGLADGTRYYFTVRAYNTSGSSAPSAEVSGATTGVQTFVGGLGAARAADFSGDLKSDIVVYRPTGNLWYVLKSDANYTTFTSFHWGAPGDVPVSGDYDGDGKADVAVWRPSTGTWYVLASSSNYTQSFSRAWGSASMNDVPLVGDFDGDGKTDIAVWRPGTGMW